MIKSKFRFVAMLLCIVCLLGALSGCADTTPAETEPVAHQLNPDIPDGILGFETIFACYETGMIGGDKYDDLHESKVRMYYLREKLTDVVYVWRTSGRQSSNNGYSYWSSGMTVMMDPATGGPLTYDAFLSYIRSMRIMCDECNKEFDEPVSYCPDCGAIVSITEEKNG